MITYAQAIILGLIQGISELFPISSLGHSVIIPGILGWNIHQNDSFFLTFLVGTHFATALVLFLFFFKEWKRIIIGMLKSLRERRIDHANPSGRLGWLLVMGTIPAGIIGLLFQDKLQLLFASPRAAAFFLVINGILLFLFEALRKRTAATADADAAESSDNKGADTRVAKVSWIQSIAIGIGQAASLIPGISRSGITMGSGLLVGLSNEDAAYFGFLLATPIIFAAAFSKFSDFFSAANRPHLGPAIVGAVCAGLAAFFAVKFLLRFFKTNRLTPFAWYSVAAGIIALIILFLK